MFHKILIANRGEVAVRILRACRELGIRTVAVYSKADAEALHVQLADEAVCIGPAKLQESYLNMGAILSAALATGAEAIHPGYGLLSENALFAKRVKEAGLVFIGPTAEQIELLGDKEQARLTMQKAGVPVIPGTEVLETAREAFKEAKRMGTPVLIKARSGGGGKGIRRVDDLDEIPGAFAAATAEAKAAFGDGACYMERMLLHVKHVEMQLLCDQYGHAVCLGERECSVQRGNQKLLEECPSPAVSSSVRSKMVKAALAAAKAVGYQGLGTMEFLLDRDGKFYFMEMNTRLQVEHPVTEEVTGIDLVKSQIRVAAGKPLKIQQKDIEFRGHSIECRINAEDGRRGFLPQSGRVESLHVPGGPGVRFDSALYEGCMVPPYYDSMLGKLIVHAHNRKSAVAKMRAALAELCVEPLPNTGDVLMDILEEPAFLDGSYDTGLLATMNL